MKSVLLFALLGALSASVHALDLDYKVGFRSPVGSNLAGGKQIQINNPGSQANDEFRLGNETAYGEAYFTIHTMKRTKAQDPFFDTNFTFAYSPRMDSQYGDQQASDQPVQLIQAFVEGGHVDGVPLAFWAGKRFYRDVDVYMDDFYYFANMSGNGGGVEDIPTGNGSLAIALLQHSDESVTKATHGFPSKQAIDIRWRDFKLNDFNSLNLWVAGARAAAGSGVLNSNPVQYQAANGLGVGLRWRHNIDAGFNDFAVMYGTGILESYTLDNNAYVQSGSDVVDRVRWRVVEHYAKQLSRNWEVETAGIADWTNATPGNWYSIGVRPVYYITDHYHLASQVGESIVDHRTLTRVSLAPELAFGRGLFKWPIVRAYVTYSRWNDRNKDKNDTNSIVHNLDSQGVTALDGRNDFVQVGVEGEVWF